MKNFTIGVVAGVLLAFLTAIILAFAAIRWAGSYAERAPNIADGSVLVLKLQGDLPETAGPEIPLPLFEAQAPLTVAQTWETLRKAAADSRIKAVILEPRGVSAGFARLEEIHQQLSDFRKSGKPLVTLLYGAGTREYYLATAADKIYMLPEDTLDVKGMRVEGVFLKNTLDKIGVKMDVIHAGKYKDAGDMFTRTSMSPETKEVLNDVLDQWYGDTIQTIATGRKLPPDQVRAAIDRGPFTAQEALTARFVDTLAYEDQLEVDLKARLKQNVLKRVLDRSYLRVPASSVGAAGPNRIALIVGEGEIFRGNGDSSLFGVSAIFSGKFNKVLRQVANDSSIKGAILRVNSPGGDAVASDDILHEVKNLSRKKPVVISMSDYAASGGYFMAMTGDPIVAYPDTLTGSIGVIVAKPNLKGLYDKIGVDKQLLTRGRNAAIDSDYQPLTPEGRQKIDDEVSSIYGGFISRVAAARKKSPATVQSLAQGRVWLGAQAKANGLVDDLGGLDTAIGLVKRKAKIPPSGKITLVAYPPKQSILDILMKKSDDSAAVNTMVISQFRRLTGDLPISLLTRGGPLKLMPYTISAH